MWGIIHISRLLTCEGHQEAKSATGRRILLPRMFRSQGLVLSLPDVKNLALRVLAGTSHIRTTGVEPVVTGKLNRRKHSQRSRMMWRPGSRMFLAGACAGPENKRNDSRLSSGAQVSLPPQNAVPSFVTPTQLS